MVSNFVLDMKANLPKFVNAFKAGNISTAFNSWESITSDPDVLQTVSGLQIEFEGSIPPETNLHTGDHFKREEKLFIMQEIDRLLQKKVIVPCQHEYGEFISPIFLVPKSDGGFRLILNLKKLNEFMPYVHFKMDTIEKVLKLVVKNCYFAKIDIKDAYYSVKIAKEFQKYLKFIYSGVLYQFTCLPNGLCSGPRKFTKLLKPPLAELRIKDVVVSGYIDDLITLGQSFYECFNNIKLIVPFLQSLGFVIHPEKSLFYPVQEIEYLGVIINSVSMTVKLTDKKKEKILALCDSVLNNNTPHIRVVAKLLGYFSYSFLAVKYSKLHYRCLERDKIEALKTNKGNFDSKMSLSLRGYQDINWWIKNIASSYEDIYLPNHSVVITTDACKTGWGAVTSNNRTSGLFLSTEKDNHINVLELLAVYYGLQALLRHKKDCHIKILSDNTTTVQCINNMGSCKSLDCDNVTKKIWNMAVCISYPRGPEH